MTDQFDELTNLADTDQETVRVPTTLLQWAVEEIERLREFLAQSHEEIHSIADELGTDVAGILWHKAGMGPKDIGYEAAEVEGGEDGTR